MLLPGPDGIANGKATAGARFSSPGPRGSLSPRDSSSLIPLDIPVCVVQTGMVSPVGGEQVLRYHSLGLL